MIIPQEQIRPRSDQPIADETMTDQEPSITTIRQTLNNIINQASESQQPSRP